MAEARTLFGEVVAAQRRLEKKRKRELEIARGAADSASSSQRHTGPDLPQAPPASSSSAMHAMPRTPPPEEEESEEAEEEEEEEEKKDRADKHKADRIAKAAVTPAKTPTKAHVASTPAKPQKTCASHEGSRSQWLARSAFNGSKTFKYGVGDNGVKRQYSTEKQAHAAAQAWLAKQKK